MTYFNGHSAIKLQNLVEVDFASWSFSEFFSDSIDELVRSSNLVPISSFTSKTLESRLGEKGGWVAAPNPNPQSWSLVLEKAETSSATYEVKQPDKSVFLSSDNRAFFAPADRAGVRMSGRFRGFEFSSEEEALWVWVALNSRLYRDSIERLEILLTKWSQHRPATNEIYIGRMPTTWPSSITEAKRLVTYVAERHSESRSVSMASLVQLQGLDKWSLRIKSHTTTASSKSTRLAEFVTAARTGKALNSEFAKAGIPVLEGRWLATGRVEKFLDTSTADLTLAKIGDVITPRIGESSRARVVTQPGAVPAGFIVLELNGKAAPKDVVAFLNSENASAQRSELCVEGTIYKTISPTKILEMVPDFSIVDVQAKCLELCEK